MRWLQKNKGDFAMCSKRFLVSARVALFLAAASLVGWLAGSARLAAGPINPQVYKKEFEKVKKDADLVAKVRVLAAVCTEAKGEKPRTVTLQVSLQVLDVEK